MEQLKLKALVGQDGMQMTIGRILEKIFPLVMTLVVLTILVMLGGYIYVSYFLFGECGMDDGPFIAEIVDYQSFSESIDLIALKEGELIIDNRSDTLSPIISLRELDKIRWSLDLDVRNTEGYESFRIWSVQNVSVKKDHSTIRITFTAGWSFGNELGYMEIDRADGANSFCLSW